MNKMRKEILPKWIRFFSWIFLMMFMAPVVFLFGLTGVSDVSFMFFGLGYEGKTSLDPIAIIVTAVATLSATVAYGILWGKDWALSLGIIYGWIGLATCAVAFFLNSYIPLEPIFLIPFIVVLNQKKEEWIHYQKN